MSESLAAAVAEPLIAPDNTWALWAIMVGWVAVSIRLEQSRRWASAISGPVLVLVGAVALSNTRVIPTASPVYDTVFDYIVPTCVPLLLFRANLGLIVRESGWMFLVFHLSALGTVLGALLAFVILRTAGLPDFPELLAIMTGSYTGGAVNFAALSSHLQPEEELANALLVADNLVMAIFFLVCFSLTSIPPLRRLFRTPFADAVEAESSGGGAATAGAEYWKPKPIALLDIAQALAIAVAIAAAGNLLADLVAKRAGEGWVTDVFGHPYPFITVICVVVATVFHRQLERISGAEELGTWLIYLFFFVIGAPADVIGIIREVPVIFVLCGIMAATNLAVTLALTLVCRRTLEEAALTVNATLGGAPSAAAMAIAKGWRPLVLPAFLVGIWGYVVGTWLGIVVWRVLT